MSDFHAGQRVHLDPETKAAKMGLVTGEVVKVTRNFGESRVHVRMDRDGRVLQCKPDNVIAD